MSFVNIFWWYISFLSFRLWKKMIVIFRLKQVLIADVLLCIGYLGENPDEKKTGLLPVSGVNN